MANNRVEVVITADASQLTGGLKQAEGAVDRFADRAEKALGGIDPKQGLRGLPGAFAGVADESARAFGSKFKAVFKEALDPKNLAQGFAQGVGQGLTNLPFNAAAGGFNLVAGAVGSSLDKFKEFSGTIQRIGVLTGETGTADMAALKKEIESLGASTSKSATEVAQMAVELSAAGFTAKEQKEALRGIVLGSEATGESLKRVGEVGASTVRSFTQVGLSADSTGLKAQDMGRVMDALVATGNASASGIDDLGESLKYLAPTANANKQPLNDMLVALGLLANNGIKGSMAGTNLSSALERLSINSALAGKFTQYAGKSLSELQEIKGQKGSALKGLPDQVLAMISLGVNARNAAGEMRPLSELLPELRSSLNSLDAGSRAIVVNELFGTEGARAMNTLISATDADIAKMKTTIDQAGGSAVKAGAELQKGFGPALEQLGGAIETLQLKFGEALAPAIEGIARLLGDLFSRMAETGMFDQMGAAFQQLGQTLMGLAGNDAVMDSLAQAISSVVTALAQMTGEGAVAFANWIQQMAPQIPGLAAGFQEFALKAIEVAQGLAPIAQAGLMVVGVVAQLGLAWGGFMNEIGLPVLQTVVTVLNAIGGAIGSVLQAVGGMLQGLAGVAGVVPGLSEALGGSAAALQQSGAAMQQFGSQMTGAQGAIQGAAGAAGNLATATQGAVGSTTALGTATQGAGAAAQGATGGLKSAASGANSLSGAAGKAASANQGLAGAAQGAAGAVTQQAGAANAAANANRGQAAALGQAGTAAATLATNTQRAGDSATGASKGFSQSTVAILGMLGPLGQVAAAAANLWGVLSQIMGFRPPSVPGAGGGGKPPAKPAKPAKPPARAKGGPVWPGEAFLVGERGPELFVPPGSGYILTAAETSSLLGAGVPGFARGGRVRGAEPIVVGEQGPESFFSRMYADRLQERAAVQIGGGSIGGGGGGGGDVPPVDVQVELSPSGAEADLAKEVDRVIAAIDALATSLGQGSQANAESAFKAVSEKSAQPIDQGQFNDFYNNVRQLLARGGGQSDAFKATVLGASEGGIDPRLLGVKLSDEVAKQVEANLAKVAQAAQEKTATGLGAAAGKVDKGAIDQTKAAEALGAKFDALAEEVRALAQSPRDLTINGSQNPAADAAKLMEQMQVLASAGVRR
jgi:TP901 family phage tail tape measure protein